MSPPPNRHLLVVDSHLHLVVGPRVNHSRPAADPLFRTAARAFGRRVAGVVLTGSLDDGTAGLMAVKLLGGVTIVQDPKDASYSGMPQSAIANVAVDYVLPLAEIPALLVKLAQPDPEGEATVSDDSGDNGTGAGLVAHDTAMYEEGKEEEGPSVWICPECGGVLWEVQDGELIRFRCHVGHAYSVEAMLTSQADALEAALWSAVRALRERAMLARRLAARMRERDSARVAAEFEEQAAEADEQARLVRGVIERQVLSDEAMQENAEKEGYASSRRITPG